MIVTNLRLTIMTRVPKIPIKLSHLNNDLNSKVDGFTEDTYSAVTGLAYDSTNNKLGLKVGADTVIPFSKGNYTLSIPIYYYGQTRSAYGGSYTRFGSNATITIKIADGVATITGGASGYQENDVGSNMIGGRGYSLSAITVTEN